LRRIQNYSVYIRTEYQHSAPVKIKLKAQLKVCVTT